MLGMSSQRESPGRANLPTSVPISSTYWPYVSPSTRPCRRCCPHTASCQAPPSCPLHMSISLRVALAPSYHQPCGGPCAPRPAPGGPSRAGCCSPRAPVRAGARAPVRAGARAPVRAGARARSSTRRTLLYALCTRDGMSRVIMSVIMSGCVLRYRPTRT